MKRIHIILSTVMLLSLSLFIFAFDTIDSTTSSNQYAQITFKITNADGYGEGYISGANYGNGQSNGDLASSMNYLVQDGYQFIGMSSQGEYIIVIMQSK